eukprot:1139974-Pelagomonas_calceolata.AAC.8
MPKWMGPFAVKHMVDAADCGAWTPKNHETPCCFHVSLNNAVGSDRRTRPLTTPRTNCSLLGDSSN